MTLRPFLVLAGSLLLSLASFTSPIQAQDWRQEVQIITTVGYDDPLQVFADSVSALFARHPDLLVRREAKAPFPIPASRLREELFENGVDINSATHTLVRYTFTLGRGSEVIETVTDIYFIYRGNDTYADVPILHLDTAEPIVGNFIRSRGIPSLVNMETGDTFREMLSFPYLKERQETAMVEIGRRPLRGYTVTHSQQVLEKFLNDHILGSGTYVLAVSEPKPPKLSSANASTVEAMAPSKND